MFKNDITVFENSGKESRYTQESGTNSRYLGGCGFATLTVLISGPSSFEVILELCIFYDPCKTTYLHKGWSTLHSPLVRPEGPQTGGGVC